MKLRLGVLFVGVLILGCASGAATPSPAPVPTATPAPPVVVKVADSGFGQIIVDANGYSLYSNWDENTERTCVDECTQTWEPYTVDGEFAVGAGLNRSDFSTVARPEGGMQLKFHNYPLYHFSQDVNAGDAKGNGAFAIWYLIRSDGRVVFDDTPTTSPY